MPLPNAAAEPPPCPTGEILSDLSPTPDKPACSVQLRHLQHACPANYCLFRHLPPVRGRTMPGTASFPDVRRAQRPSSMYPPDPPLRSWLGRPAVTPPLRRTNRCPIPGPSRLIPPAGRWKRPQVSAGDGQGQGRRLIDACLNRQLGHGQAARRELGRRFVAVAVRDLEQYTRYILPYPPNTQLQQRRRLARAVRKHGP